tara:strand:+ start:7204 stop:8550 length:1347 start_codon:yes stop_codon:yes gene_type:complete
MNRTGKQTALAVLVLSGSAATLAQANNPVALDASRVTVNNAGHIYYNIATGERVVTLFSDGQTAPADTGESVPVWASGVANPCEAFGYTTQYFFGVDDASGTTSLATNVRLLDYGDIAHDTVVDCIQINWTVAHPDVDLDSDGIVDGVEELAGNWIVWEADNGRAIDQSSRLPIVDFMFFNLPGNTPENQGAGALTGWTADVDLVAFGTSTDLSFEIGNTDGDCQTAAFCQDFDIDSDGEPDGVGWSGVDFNFDGLPDSDIDGDGYFDWSWSVNFIQPGQGNDFDSDSDTGSLPGSSSDTIGVGFGVPEGMAIDNGDGTWTWDIDETAQGAGIGAEDRFVLYEPTSGGDFVYNGGYWFGGFACTGGLISEGGLGYTPPAMFQFVLYGPGNIIFEPCDYNGDGVANFFDVSAFLQDFNDMAPMADLNNDGSWDFFDVSAFLTAFNAGCP